MTTSGPPPFWTGWNTTSTPPGETAAALSATTTSPCPPGTPRQSTIRRAPSSCDTKDGPSLLGGAVFVHDVRYRISRAFTRRRFMARARLAWASWYSCRLFFWSMASRAWSASRRARAASISSGRSTESTSTSTSFFSIFTSPEDTAASRTGPSGVR